MSSCAMYLVVRISRTRNKNEYTLYLLVTSCMVSNFVDVLEFPKLATLSPPVPGAFGYKIET